MPLLLSCSFSQKLRLMYKILSSHSFYPNFVRKIKLKDGPRASRLLGDLTLGLTTSFNNVLIHSTALAHRCTPLHNSNLSEATLSRAGCFSICSYTDVPTSLVTVVASVSPVSLSFFQPVLLVFACFRVEQPTTVTTEECSDKSFTHAVNSTELAGVANACTPTDNRPLLSAACMKGTFACVQLYTA